MKLVFFRVTKLWNQLRSYQLLLNHTINHGYDYWKKLTCFSFFWYCKISRTNSMSTSTYYIFAFLSTYSSDLKGTSGWTLLKLFHLPNQEENNKRDLSFHPHLISLIRNHLSHLLLQITFLKMSGLSAVKILLKLQQNWCFPLLWTESSNPCS